MIHPRCLLGSLLLLCASCVAVPHQEPWAPLRLTLDDHIVGSHCQAFVYVDGVYRGNFVAGNFMMYLTLKPHEVRVSAPGFDEWIQSVQMSGREYPEGTAVVVTPTRGKQGA